MDALRATDPLAAPWVLLVLLCAFGLLGWTNLVSPRKWSLLMRSFFSLRLGRQSLRDELDLQDRTLIGLAVMACALLALLACQFAELRMGIRADLGMWAGAMLLVAVVVAVQVLLLYGLGFIFQGEAGIAEYVYTLLLFYIAAGLVLFPITSMLAFPHQPSWRAPLLWAGLGCLVLVLLFRWVRAAAVGLGEGVPFRYIFIYLCALEILPIAILLLQLRARIPVPSHNP